MTKLEFDIFLERKTYNFINDNYVESAIEIIESDYYVNNHYKKNCRCVFSQNLRLSFLKHFNKKSFLADIHLYLRKDGQLMQMTSQLQKKIYNKYKK